MQKINLYRYEINGKVIVTPNSKNVNDEPSRIRLIADNGYVLTNGKSNVPAIDIMTEDVSLWSEIIEIDETTELEQKAQAYDILMGVTE